MKTLFKRCPKSNKIVGIQYDNKWFWVISPVVACLALIWFLIRVIPKPQRAAYPCQRMAMSIFGGFFSYLAGTTFIGALLHKAKKNVSRRKFSVALCCLLTAAMAATFTLSGSMGRDRAFSAQMGGYASFTPPDGANQPVGQGKGIHPGRVVFVRDERAVTNQDGSSYWWDDQNTDPEIVKNLFSACLTELTGEPSSSQAWTALFEHFNQQKTGTAADYQPGEKIVIKLNQNQDDGTGWYQDHMTAPQLLDALLSDLIDVVGVHPADITLIDASRNFSDCIYQRVNQKFPGVRMVAQNRIKPTRDTQHPIYFSGDHIPTGYVPSDYAEATYMINIGLFRIHNQYGITLCGKNHFGSVDFDNGDKGKFLPTPMHVSWNNDYDSYSPLTELMAHDLIGGKTFLYLIDALYASNMQNNPIVTNLASFDGKTPCGIFASQDPVAIDSVGFDYLASEPNLDARGANGIPDNYLHEAAELGDPPSGIRYDTNGTGIVPDSLGVHEHWNNSLDRQYSRNLGKSEGIELIEKDYTPQSVTFTASRLELNGQDFSNSSVITGEGMLEGIVTCVNQSGPSVAPLVSAVLTDASSAGKQMVDVATVRFLPVSAREGEKEVSFRISVPDGMANGQLSIYIWEGLSLQPWIKPLTWQVKN